jgi:hypothetical protein
MNTRSLLLAASLLLSAAAATAFASDLLARHRVDDACAEARSGRLITEVCDSAPAYREYLCRTRTSSASDRIARHCRLTMPRPVPAAFGEDTVLYRSALCVFEYDICSGRLLTDGRRLDRPLFD